MSLAKDKFTSNHDSSVLASTFSHITSGSDRIMVVGVTTRNAGPITGITYNGDSLTKILEVSPYGGYCQSMWYLIAPDTGTHNVVVTATYSEHIDSYVQTLTGALQSDQPNAFTSYYSNAQKIDATLTTTTDIDNCFLFLVFGARGNSFSISNKANMTQLASGYNSFFLEYTNNPQSVAGSVSTGKLEFSTYVYPGLVFVAIEPKDQPILATGNFLQFM